MYIVAFSEYSLFYILCFKLFILKNYSEFPHTFYLVCPNDYISSKYTTISKPGNWHI